MELGNCMEIVWKCSMELGNRMEIVQKCSVELRNCMEMAWNLEFMWKYHGNNMEIENNIEILSHSVEVTRKYQGSFPEPATVRYKIVHCVVLYNAAILCS